MLDNLEMQNMMWRFVWENKKAMSIHCNMNRIKDKYSSFQTLRSSKLFSCFPSLRFLSLFVKDSVIRQEVEETKIRHFRRKNAVIKQ